MNLLMQSKNSLFSLIRRLWLHMALRRRKQFGLLLILMIFASFAEVFSIGAILPFLGVLTAPQRVFEHSIAQPVIQFLNLTTGIDFSVISPISTMTTRPSGKRCGT